MLGLANRSRQAENFDRPNRPLDEVARDYRQLSRVNRFFHFVQPFGSLIEQHGGGAVGSMDILDIGSGDGSLGRALHRMAARKGWEWRFTNLDINRQACGLQARSNGFRAVVGSALSLPFNPDRFDAVIASQMTHHFDRGEEVVRHFSEAWRVTRGLLIISDLHRSRLLYVILSMITRVLGLSKSMRHDGLLSVRRSFRVHEWRDLAGQAGISNPEVFVYHRARLTLMANKAG